MDRIIGQGQFTGHSRCGFALADASQQQNHLGRAQLLVCKHRARKERIHHLTVTTAIARDLTTAGAPEVPRVLHGRVTLRTAQAARMKVLAQPDLTEIVVAYVK